MAAHVSPSLSLPLPKLIVDLTSSSLSGFFSNCHDQFAILNKQPKRNWKKDPFIVRLLLLWISPQVRTLTDDVSLPLVRQLSQEGQAKGSS